MTTSTGPTFAVSLSAAARTVKSPSLALRISSPFDRIASRCAPRAMNVTSCPDLASFAPKYPPTAPDPRMAIRIGVNADTKTGEAAPFAKQLRLARAAYLARPPAGRLGVSKHARIWTPYGGPFHRICGGLHRRRHGYRRPHRRRAARRRRPGRSDRDQRPRVHGRSRRARRGGGGARQPGGARRHEPRDPAAAPRANDGD